LPRGNDNQTVVRESPTHYYFLTILPWTRLYTLITGYALTTFGVSVRNNFILAEKKINTKSLVIFLFLISPLTFFITQFSEITQPQ